MLRLLSRELDAALSELRLCHNRAFMEMKEGWSWCRVLAGDDSGGLKLPGADHGKLWVVCRTYLTRTFLFQLSRPQEILLLNFAKEEK